MTMCESAELYWYWVCSLCTCIIYVTDYIIVSLQNMHCIWKIMALYCDCVFLCDLITFTDAFDQLQTCSVHKSLLLMTYCWMYLSVAESCCCYNCGFTWKVSRMCSVPICFCISFILGHKNMAVYIWPWFWLILTDLYSFSYPAKSSSLYWIKVIFELTTEPELPYT